MGDDELVVAHVDPHGGPLDGPVAQQRAGDLGLDLSGDESTQRPGPVHRVVALLRDEAAGALADLHRDVAFGEPHAQVGQHELDDVLDLARAERREQHGVVDPVEELWPEVARSSAITRSVPPA